MEITKRSVGDQFDLAVTGRLDAQSAGLLSQELAGLVQKGSRHLRLDLARVDFMSSAGLRVLLQFYKQLKHMQGSFVISDASAPVKTVMALAGFEELLGMKPMPSSKAAPAAFAVDQGRVSLLERGGATFEVFERAPYATLSCRAFGDADAAGRGLSARHCRTMQFPEATLAVGMGAFGHDFQDCRGRFGRFLAAAGTVAYHPAEGGGAPDYQMQTGAFLPDVQVLDGLVCEGSFSHFIRFEAGSEGKPVRFAELAESCLVIARADAAGLVMVAEAANPAGGAIKGRSMIVAAGVAARSDRPSLEPWLRPLGERSWPTGRIHAAVFSGPPLKKGEIDLRGTVAGLFEESTLRQILQLGRDGRSKTSPGQDEFLRGACWIGPIADVTVERTDA